MNEYSHWVTGLSGVGVTNGCASAMWALSQEHTSSDKSTDKLLTIEPSLLPQ